MYIVHASQKGGNNPFHHQASFRKFLEDSSCYRWYLFEFSWYWISVSLFNILPILLWMRLGKSFVSIACTCAVKNYWPQMSTKLSLNIKCYWFGWFFKSGFDECCHIFLCFNVIWIKLVFVKKGKICRKKLKFFDKTFIARCSEGNNGQWRPVFVPFS